MRSQAHRWVEERNVHIPYDGISLEADLGLPINPRGVVLFANGSSSSRLSPSNRAVARELQDARFATLLLDLLTVDEEHAEVLTGHFRFDIELLSLRLAAATNWATAQRELRGLPVGYFGASTGAAAAIVAAAMLPRVVGAIVSRGGRPDLAGSSLHGVCAPTLLIVGELDRGVIDLNHQALRQLSCPAALKIVPHASHLFGEPGTLEQVSMLTRHWFDYHLAPRTTRAVRLAPIRARSDADKDVNGVKNRVENNGKTREMWK